MSTTEKILKLYNEIGDLRYKLAHADHFNLTEMQRGRTVRHLKQLYLVLEKLERLTRPVPPGYEVTCQQRCDWPHCSLSGCLIKQP